MIVHVLFTYGNKLVDIDWIIISMNINEQRHYLQLLVVAWVHKTYQCDVIIAIK